MTGLAKQLIPMSFGQGIDTKPDKKQQRIGDLRRARNVIFETLNAARKRNGYDSIPLQTTTNSMISGATMLTKFKNELNLLDATTFYSFSPSLQKMQAKGPLYNVIPSSTPVLNNSYNHDTVDVALVENLKVFVYHNTSLNQIRYSVQDNATGSLLVSNDLVETGEFVRVANVNNFVYIIYANGANLRYRRFNILTPATLQVAVNIATNVDTANPKIDAENGPGRIVVAYNSNVGAAKLRIFGINSDGSTTGIVGVTGADPSEALDITLDSGSRAVISFSNGTLVRYTVYPFNLGAAILPPTTIETIANVTAVSGIETTTPNTYRFYYEISNVVADRYRVRTNTGTLAGVVGTAQPFLRSVGMGAKVFAVNGATYIPVAFSTTVQDTYFIVNSDGVIVSKISPGIGGGHVTANVLPHSLAIDTTQVLIATQIKSRTESENGVFFSPFGVLSTTLDFAPTDPYSNALLGENLHIAGGLLQMYDGDSVVEHGFNVYPEGIAAGATATTGGSISDGDRGYQAVYRWTDNGGQDHYSAPSEVLQVVLSGGTATQTQAVIVPTLRLTAKENVVIEIYRTEDDGTIFYQVTSITAPTFNDKTTDTITFVDTVSDAALISRKPLYTTGGVLENIAPSSASIVAVHTASNRIILAGLENKNQIQFSKQHETGTPVEFNDELVIPVDPVGGVISAVVPMDDKIIIFETDAIFFVNGSGPNNLGQQDTFTVPELIPGEVGCTEPRSVVRIPQGIMFKSRKGIFLLTNGLAVQYIGSNVEEYNALNITSAKTIGKFNQVRFTTSDGDCLVYNYNLGLWCTFDNHRAKSAETIGDDYYYIRSDSELFQENPTKFSDNGVPIKLYLETAWMNFNVFQGFQRIYKALVIGDYKSEHLFRIRAAYNYNEAFTQEETIQPSATFIDPTAYGEYSPYGEPVDLPYGGEGGNVYQARFDFKQQKCQAIKISIEDQQDVAGEGLSLSAITFQVGAKVGVFKVDGVAKFGVS